METDDTEKPAFYGTIKQEEAAAFADIWKAHYGVELPLEKAAEYLAVSLITDSIFGRKTRMERNLEAVVYESRNSV